MKKIIILLLLIPSFSFAQKVELALNVGVDKDEQIINSSLPVLGLKASIGAITNIENVQIGCGMELGPETFGVGYIMPYALVNYKYNFRIFYLYTGMMGGWIRYQGFPYSFKNLTNLNSNGYNLGFQAGAVLKLNDHFGFNTELSARNATLWNDNSSFIFEGMPNRYSEFYLSATIGMRYRF